MNIALLGAGGKMGGRITANLRQLPEYTISYVEVSESGRRHLQENGIATVDTAEAVAAADIVILGIPDNKIGEVTNDIAPSLRPGSIVVGLDPAAAYAGVLAPRTDITYFIAHPCHPPLFTDTAAASSATDWFGGNGRLPQSVVCALYQGPEKHYEIGEKLAAAMFAPILRMHRVTVEQMAILEPAVVESTMLTCITVLRQAMERAIELGVPEEAAKDFCLGHIRTLLAIVFGFAGFPVSDGAKRAATVNHPRIFRENWQDVISIPAVKESVQDICAADAEVA
jgi:D-apionate oxidoisomerase